MESTNLAPCKLRFDRPRIVYRNWWHRLMCWLGVPQKSWMVEYDFTVLADDTVME